MSMAKTFYILVKGGEGPHEIEADNIEQDGTYLALRKGNTVVAKFKEAEVQGWWIED